jgi:hypothetical protein
VERTDVIGTEDDDDLTIVGEHAVLAELRRRAARPFAPPAPSPLPPPTLPVVQPQPQPRPRTIHVDAQDWWDDDDADGSVLMRWGLRLLAVLAVAGLALFGLRSCADDGTSTMLPPVDGQSIPLR